MWIEFVKDSANASNVVFCQTEANSCFSENSLSSSWLVTSQTPAGVSQQRLCEGVEWLTVTIEVRKRTPSRCT